jgi:DNA repair protein RadA/Sms
MQRTIKTAGYECGECGAHYTSWSGRCDKCGKWNTIEISNQLDDAHTTETKPLIISSVADHTFNAEKRIKSGIASLDLLFGGGIVEGSVILISGEPGMGKSTLLMQLGGSIAINNSTLYVSGEESLHQIGLRAKRLGLIDSKLDITSTTSAEAIAEEVLSSKYKVVIVDSIQTIKSQAIGTSYGSVAQVSNCTSLLTLAAKHSNTALIIVGQVTKDGNIAGPKQLEHMVDVVVSLEGDRSGGLKLLRCSKNRFGSTNETLIFEMKANGLLAPVINPSAVLLAERKITDGSIVLAAMEGSRPLLLEVQALVNRTSYGYPKRAANGISLSRLNLIIAMLERRLGFKLGEKDIYLNVVGGITAYEPAADLAIVMAIASADKGVAMKDNSVVFGEVGLSGEVRHVPYIQKRLTEAKNLGFDYAIGPKPLNTKSSVFLHPVTDISSALKQYLV